MVFSAPISWRMCLRVRAGGRRQRAEKQTTSGLRVHPWDRGYSPITLAPSAAEVTKAYPARPVRLLYSSMTP